MSSGDGAGRGAAPHGLSWALFPGAAILVFSMAPAWAAGSGANPAPRASGAAFASRAPRNAGGGRAAADRPVWSREVGPGAS